MTTEEAKKALQEKTVVFLTEEPKSWGIISCLSDDETLAYCIRGSSFRFAYMVKDLSASKYDWRK